MEPKELENILDRIADEIEVLKNEDNIYYKGHEDALEWVLELFDGYNQNKD